MTEEDRPRRETVLHVLGQSLDNLSLHDFDERIAFLRAEIARLEQSRERKRVALAAADSVFGPR